MLQQWIRAGVSTDSGCLVPKILVHLAENEQTIRTI